MAYEALQQMVDESSRIVFFGGAGVSTESGIPDFRSVDGLYHQKYDYPPETILSHTFFVKRPEAFFRFFGIKKLSGIIPVWLCILISSVAFGIMHVKSFTAPEFLYYLPTIAAAVVWGIALHMSRNITIPLIMHIMINLPAVVVLYLS